MGHRLPVAPITDADAAPPSPTRPLVWIETPTNPLLNVGDIAVLAEITHGAGANWW